jgi:serine/threonine-protein kinase PknK
MERDALENVKVSENVPSRLADLFVLEGEVARGASGRVFRARSRGNGGRAAIKCVDHPSVREEARLLAELDLEWGPHVLASGTEPSASFGESEGRSEVAWVAYTWAEGRALDVRALPESREARLRIAAVVAHGVARALEEIHALGVRHGDVKPANVVVRDALLSGDSEELRPSRDLPEERGASLVDFGFATRGRGLLGASPRYAAPELEVGGPALVQADLFALGLVLGEIVGEGASLLEKAALRDEIATWGAAAGPEAWARALVSRAPLGRPPAGWVAEQAASWLGLEAREERARAARVRAVARSAVALRVTASEGRECADDAGLEERVDERIGEPMRSWLAEARERLGAASFGARVSFPAVEPLGTLSVQRWLVSLVGPRAASFPVPNVDEATLARRLVGYAERGSLATLSWRDLEVEPPLSSNDSPSGRADFVFGSEATFDVVSAASTLRELGGELPSVATTRRLEAAISAGTCPVPVAVAFAEYLVRSGEIGRAHAALAWVERTRENEEETRPRREGVREHECATHGCASEAIAEALIVLAEVARRRGEPERATALAHRAETSPEYAARARALLARLAWERGDLLGAERLASGPGALAAEVRGLVAYSRGSYDEGLEDVHRARIEARDGFAAARLDAVVGMLEHARGDAEASLRAFARAVDHATRAGAFVEEATYATGAAAAATDAGYVALALAYGMRAALLWERLAQPARAARAWLSRAAAYGLLGAGSGAEQAAREAMRLAEISGDSQASAYACWAYAEALGGAAWASLEPPSGFPSLDEARTRAADAARRADETLALADPSDAVRVRAASRLLAYATLPPERARACDDVARYTDLPTRWEWWGARAEKLVACARGDAGAAGHGNAKDDAHATRDVSVTGDAVDVRFDGRRVVTELLALLAEGARVPVGSRGPALGAVVELARELGDGDATRRFEHALGELAERVRRGGDAYTSAEALGAVLAGDTSGGVADAFASATSPASASAKPHWTRFRESAPQGSALSQPQIAQLESIVRSLGTGEGLRPLLAQVLDALVLWTGVERGLLLVRAPNGRLVPRVARNLAREDLVGEQLALSTTLAQRALETGEAIVAIDALATHGETHASVHALRLRSVLAVPLCARGEVLGVAYLDDRMKKAAFGPSELGWVRLLATQAAMAISDARDKVRLRRALRHEARAAERARLLLGRREAELDAVRATLAATGDAGGEGIAGSGIVGTSAALAATLRVAVRVAASDVPVLVTGESGTGKELVARAIHARGARRERPFVSENCASVPESLLESTLFGHVKGAFTGASSTRIGLFDVAHRGTLFLDEIGEMSPAMQAKLLRVLQDGEVRPVGSERTRNVDVRIIGATHRDLEAMVKAGTFREDLYYRLNVVTLRVPPLRERPADIPLLFAHFLGKYGAGRVPQVTRAAMNGLQAYAWPGNVRQLENEARRALVLADDHIDVAELSPEITLSAPALASESPATLRGKLDELETELVRAALDAANGNQTKAALALGVSRFGLQKMLKRLGIR